MEGEGVGRTEALLAPLALPRSAGYGMVGSYKQVKVCLTLPQAMTAVTTTL